MRIDNNLPNPGISDSSRTTATRSAGSESTTGHMRLPTSEDQVDLSGASSLLSTAKSLSSDKQAKIQALTAQYSAGTYTPDAAATSRSLLQSMKR